MTQFQSAFKKLMLGASKKAQNIDDNLSLSILDVDFKKPPEENVSKSKIEWINLYCDSGDSSEYCNEILSYISGYVHRRILFNEKCSGCYDFLKSSCKKTSSFLNFVNEGGLCKPSEHVDFLIKQERVCSLKDRLVVFFIDQMLNILVWDDFGSIKLSIRLFGFEQIWLNFEICAK